MGWSDWKDRGKDEQGDSGGGWSSGDWGGKKWDSWSHSGGGSGSWSGKDWNGKDWDSGGGRGGGSGSAPAGGAIPSTPTGMVKRAPSTPSAAGAQVAPSTPVAAAAIPSTPTAAFAAATPAGPAAAAPSTPTTAFAQAIPSTPSAAFSQVTALQQRGGVAHVPSTPSGLMQPARSSHVPSTPAGAVPGTPGAAMMMGMGRPSAPGTPAVPGTPAGVVPGTPGFFAAPGTPRAAVNVPSTPAIVGQGMRMQQQVYRGGLSTPMPQQGVSMAPDQPKVKTRGYREVKPYFSDQPAEEQVQLRHAPRRKGGVKMEAPRTPASFPSHWRAPAPHEPEKRPAPGPIPDFKEWRKQSKRDVKITSASTPAPAAAGRAPMTPGLPPMHPPAGAETPVLPGGMTPVPGGITPRLPMDSGITPVLHASAAGGATPLVGGMTPKLPG